MYSVPPTRWLPVSSRERASTVHTTATRRIPTAWLDRSRRLHVKTPIATSTTARLQRKRKLARPYAIA